MGYKWANFIMKKITLVAMAVLCSVAFSNCAAKKPVKKAEAASEPAPVQKVDPQQAKLDSLRRAQEIRRIELQMQAEEAQYQADMEIAKLKAENARKATEKRLEQKLYTPCIEQSYDKRGEYLAGLGIADNQMDRQLGSGTANLAAISDITTRYIGVVKNGVSRYSKDVNARTGAKVKEGELEGQATAIGKASIEKNAEAVCREYGQADDGTFTVYIAVHVPIGKLLDDIQNKMEVLQVDADRARFRAFMEEELNKQAAEKEAEQKELETLRQQMGL